MLFRIFIANAEPRRVAEIGQSLGISGSVTGATFGFGAWGVEPTVVVELGGTTRDVVGRFADALFAAHPAEEAVYVIEDAVGGIGRLWYRDGRVE